MLALRHIGHSSRADRWIFLIRYRVWMCVSVCSDSVAPVIWLVLLD